MKLDETDDLKSYRAAGGNPDSSVNQRIRSDLVRREVVTCLSCLVSDLLLHPEVCQILDIDYDELMNLAENRNAREGVEEWISDFPPEVIDWLMRDFDTDVETAYLEQHEDPDGDREQWLRDNKSTAKELANQCLASLDGSEVEDLANKYDCWEVRECFEYWAVSSFFADDLRDLGESVGELYQWRIWGRCTTGQMISQDYVIAEVAARMGILEGQKYSWEERK